MSLFRFVPLAHEHLERWYGEAGRGPTIKGIAVFRGDELVAVAGLAIVRGNVTAFCDIGEAARPYKTAIHRTAVKFLAEAKAQHRLIMVYCDESEETAPKWLARLGFQDEGAGVWKWRISA